MSAREVWERCVSLLYPDRCLLCNTVLGYSESHFCLCEACSEQITFLDEVETCRICGSPLSDDILEMKQTLCVTCQTHIHEFDQAVSCFSYRTGLRRAILRYKFAGRRDLCRPFAALILNRLRPYLSSQSFDAVICAPLSIKSYRQRGYNQSSLLAKHIAKELQLPFMEDAFVKPLETPRQSSLRYIDRLRNVKFAFSLALPREAYEGKRFILIDDIFTTGATADALSGLLKRAGASYVLVATIATTELKYAEELLEKSIDTVIF